MSDRRIIGIRFWLLAAAAIAVAIVFPDAAIYLFASFAWSPVGLFMPVFPASVCNCSFCDTGSSTACEFQIVLAGLADSGCADCGTINGTYIGSQLTTDECCWKYNLGTLCGVADTYITFQVSFFLYNGGVAAAAPGACFNSNVMLLIQDFTATNPADCTLSGYALSGTPSTTGGLCSVASSTITVTTL